jgi:hypothetical protein
MEGRGLDEHQFMLPCWLEAKKTFDANLEAEGFAEARFKVDIPTGKIDPFEE